LERVQPDIIKQLPVDCYVLCLTRKGSISDRRWSW